MHLYSSSIKAQIITTIAGTGGSGFSGDGGLATSAQFQGPACGSFDSFGNYYFFHSFSSPRVRVIDANGIIHSVAGNGSSGFSGDGGLATSASFSHVNGIATDRRGNIFISDGGNYRIRMVNAVTHIVTTIAGTGSSGFSGDGGAATAAQIKPGGICTDTLGNIYFIDDFRIRKINISGVISTIAGTGAGGITGFSGDGGQATSAQIGSGIGICADGIGNVYFGGSGSTRIRKLILGTGIISTYGGNGSGSYTGDAIHADSASFNEYGICIDLRGIIYISDYGNDRIRKIDTNRIISTIAGNGSLGYSGDGGMSTSAQINHAQGVAIDTCGNAHIADEGNNRIRKVWLSGVAATSASSVSIAVSADTICTGMSITYTAAYSGGGSINTFYWYVNDTLVSVSSSNVFTDTLAASDSVYCLLNSHNPCAMPSMSRSNTIHSVVLPHVTPSIAITPNPNDTVCGVNAILFTATVTTGGSSPAYQWYVNGGAVGAGGNSYSYGPVNGDSVRCVLTSNADCVLPASVSSNTINMLVAPLTHPTIALSGPAIATIGNPVTITASVTGTGSSYAIHWFNYSTLFATTTIPSVTYIKVLATDSVTAKIVSDDYCYDSTVSTVLLVTENVGVTTPPSPLARAGLKLYPNPATDVLYVASAVPLESITICNILGQVLVESVPPSPGCSFAISMDNLPKGIYLVRINGLYVQRVVKE